MAASQRLILPINKAKLTASMLNVTYKNRFGYTHYGVDMISSVGDRTVYASGNGTVLATGVDSIFGNFIIIQYDNVEYNGKVVNMVFRMYHFDAVYAKRGAKVTKDTVIGIYGNTGAYSTGAHLHIEVDTDTKYIFYTPTLSGASTFFTGSKYGANANTMLNPIAVLHCKSSSPDNQIYTTANDAYINAADKTMKPY